MIDLSIVCITFNDSAGFSRTLRSISDLLADGQGEVELIVVDGASSTETLELLDELSMSATVIGEPDRGIYDAMNKGLKRASGRYVWFLNGGDESLVRWAALRGRLKSGTAVLLGDYELVGARGAVRRRSRPASDLWHALPTSHQAILYPRASMPQGGYSERFRVVADYELTARMFADDVPFALLGLRIARFYLDGLSTNRMGLIAVEAEQVQREVLRLPTTRRVLSRERHRIGRLFRTILAGVRR